MSAKQLNNLLTARLTSDPEVDLAQLVAVQGIPEHPELLGLLAYLIDPLKPGNTPNFQAVIDDSALPPFWRALAALHAELNDRRVYSGPPPNAPKCRPSGFTHSLTIIYGNSVRTPLDNPKRAVPDQEYIYLGVKLGRLVASTEPPVDTIQSIDYSLEVGFEHGWCDTYARALAICEWLCGIYRPELAHQALKVVDQSRASLLPAHKAYPRAHIRALYGF